MTLKLGRSGKRAWHAAHHPDAPYCHLTEPESALHYNSKIYIAEQLKMGNKLYLKRLCPGWHASSGERKVSTICLATSYNKYLFCEEWDRVETEKSVGSIRPDIVLYRCNIPVAAIEVRASHKVDEYKEQEILKLNLPWIEVIAAPEMFGEPFEEYEADEENLSYEKNSPTEQFERYGIGWTIMSPLPHSRVSPIPPRWVCTNCLGAPDLWLERLAEAEEKERLDRLSRISVRRENDAYATLYSDRDSNKILYARAYKFLNGLAETEDLELFVCQRDNVAHPYQPVEYYLKTNRYKSDILFRHSALEPDAKKCVNDYFKEFIARKKRAARQTVDLTNGWVTEAEYDRLKPNFRNPYKYHLILGRWILENE